MEAWERVTFGFVCKAARKSELHVIVVGDSPSAKCPPGHCVQVTSCQGWEWTAKSHVDPKSLVLRKGEGSLTGRQRDPAVLSDDELPIEASLGRV